MNLACKVFGHRIIAPAPANQGFQFSRCCRCHTDLIRSDRTDSSNWRPVPEGLRVRWGECDPDQPTPPWGIVAMARRVLGRIAAFVSAIVALCSVARAVMIEQGRAAAGAVGRVFARQRRLGSDREREPKRFSIIVLLQRNMLHLELKLARP